ncbi:MAG TPA: tetratricopeptide repeat protein [Gemmatimonadaceae bacterium]|nr:tetratricopeptide repeat protein [Gemmatimonadaceae bacterium]
MSNVAKLKKRALEYEQKKQFDKALETYAQILDGLGDHVDEADVALYNRVGDLLVRRGDVPSAVDHYEKAVDLYTDGGFFNNAIALCNKILRNAPGRTSIYYKLGKISAKKGFVNDAKQNFLEYADRMQRAGELEEAFRALKEFADLCPDQDDIRLMLADQLVRKDRKGEAIEQLQVLYEKFQSEGRTREARATVDRMKALDPELEPKTGPGRPTTKPNDLVFLDLNFDTPRSGPPGARAKTAPPPAPAAPAKPAQPAAPAPPPAAPEPEPEEVTLDVDLPFINSQAEIEPSADIQPVEGLERAESFTEPAAEDASQVNDLVSHHDSDIIVGFEQTTFEIQPDADPDVAPLAGLEPSTSADDGILSGDPLGGLGEMQLEDTDETVVRDPSGESDSIDLPLLEIPVEDADLPESVGGDLTFIYPGDTTPEVPETVSEPAPRTVDLTGFGDNPPILSDPFPDADDLDRSIDAALDHARMDSASDPLEGLPALEPEPAEDLAELPPLPPMDEAVPAVRHPAADAAVQRLRAAVQHSPNDFDVRRQLAEALLEEGERDLGLAELEHAMLGFETAGNLRSASAIAEEMIRVEPGSVRFHQKRVEYAVRANDKARLVDAYLSLAECLFGSGQLDKSRAVYSRVVELNPADERARAALAALGGDAFNPTPSSTTPISRPRVRPAPVAHPEEREIAASATPAGGSDSSFVNLADWLREDDTAKSTRMVVDVGEPAVDQQQVDFAEMLSMFKQGVAANVDETDHESHYDLGVAYKEMGLLDEAISEFQKALRGTEHRGRTYEALGQCFVEKRQYQIALTILSRALTDQHATDDQLVGVLYLLGYASEALGRYPDALKFYERVFAVDIQFRDIGDRLAAVERRAR